MDRLRESVLAAEAVLGSRAAAWHAVLAAVESTYDGAAAAALEPWREPDAVEHLASVHETLLADRNGSGSFYTPRVLVEWVLDRALPATGLPQVLDPSCGAGHFLVAVVERLVARGVDPAAAVGAVHGVDLDPVAVAIARLRLRRLAPDVEPDVRVGDGLAHAPSTPYDVVVGNPPFLGRLRRRTATGATVAGLGAYTDTSGVFLVHALGLVRPGGTVALVQPLSLLAARDAAPVRAAVRAAGAITAFWSSAAPVFEGAAVLTCTPVVTLRASQDDVATWHGAGFEHGPSLPLPDHEWGPLAAPALGIPTVTPRTSGTLADLGTCTADFRDQYYGLVPFVRDGGTGAPLVTSGLIDPAECRWGRSPTRFAKTSYGAPTVDLDALRAGSRLGPWADARLVPKVLVATQGRVIEAVVDEEGAWLPSVPVLTFVPHDPADLWRVLAVLLAPPVAARAAARYLGTALSPRAIKLSARQVLELPLPADRAAWDRAAALAEAAQRADPTARPEALRAAAEELCTAYDDFAALPWWVRRVNTA